MIELGDSLRQLRTTKQLTQKEAARLLAITDVHLSNLERNKAKPSPDLMDRIQECWGVDLYIFAWCLSGNHKNLPRAVRAPIRELTRAWKAELESLGIKT